MKSKMMIIILLLIVLIGGGIGGYFFLTKGGEETKLSATELAAFIVETEDFTTNLKNGRYIVVKFGVQLDSAEAKVEFETRRAQMTSIILSTLGSLDSKELNGAEGQDTLVKTLKKELNEAQKEGKVLDLYVMNWKIQ